MGVCVAIALKGVAQRWIPSILTAHAVEVHVHELGNGGAACLPTDGLGEIRLHNVRLEEEEGGSARQSFD